MRVLIVNKFLHPNGGSETYIFKLGKALKDMGHEVQYFGMEHEGRIVGNDAGVYTSDMDFHGGNPLKKLTYPIKTIYSKEAASKLRIVLKDFKPDVVHLNNFNYQLTPSVIEETVRWRKREGVMCRIVFTAHDYQLLCPNHMFNNPATHENCEKCIVGTFTNCVKGRCIHGSMLKSAVGAAEANFWKMKGTYKYIDCIICPSGFIKTKMDCNPLFKNKTVTIHNFVEHPEAVAKETLPKVVSFDRYVLYFGRYSVEKGVLTLAKACAELPDVNFVFAGTGEYAANIEALPNAVNVGFKTGEELESLIRNAEFTVYPSEWYENCPFSVMESQERMVPVLGANIGGIPELVEENVTGRLFESGNAEDLKEKIRMMWDDKACLDAYRENLRQLKRMDINEYANEMVRIYSGGEIL